MSEGEVADSHYETLGVEPDASRDEIRDAYRARVSELDPETWKGDASERRDRAASVNRAWNVLSDPFQKERYDRDLEAGTYVGDDDADAGSDDVAGRSNGRSPTPKGAPPVSTREGRATTTPTGLLLAPTRARINALSVDVLVILVLLFGLNFLAGVLFSNQAVQVTIKNKVEQTTELKGKTYDSLKDSVKSDAVAKWRSDNKGKTLASKDVTVDEVKVVPGNITLLFQLLTLVLALLYVSIPTVRSGKTLGKRLFKLKLVSADGTPVGLGQTLLHYGIPIAVAIALALLGAIVAIGLVLWSIWDKNGQGIDDKIAKTFVVEA